MLGVICARAPKSWIISSVTLTGQHYGSAAHHNNNYEFHFQGRRDLQSSILQSSILFDTKRHHHSSSCQLDGCVRLGGAASIWHAILPSINTTADEKKSDRNRLTTAVEHNHNQHNHHLTRGEGSWNVALDNRPARWLHRVDSAWLLFGVCSCLAPSPPEAKLCSDELLYVAAIDDKSGEEEMKKDEVELDEEQVTESKTDDDNTLTDYKVTGVLADGRCLFRAIVHGACLNNGEEAPDEDRQRELADELRAKVVDEFLKRREDTEGFIDDDFDAHLNRIKQPYVWGGEPEIVMASHVLKALIQVYVFDRNSGKLVRMCVHGEEYRKDGESPINVLFHDYGHYDLLEKKLPEVKIENKLLVGEIKLDIGLPENKSIEVVAV
ncbi:hypothetical protein ACFE04_003646 [Oxalis oulophora]